MILGVWKYESSMSGILVIRDEDDLEKLKLHNFYEIHIMGNSNYCISVKDKIGPYKKYVTLIRYVNCMWSQVRFVHTLENM
jgi:hypothetical protein